eukprot:TRINITY_DN65795_c0_g1_i3.p1 TRINITY_DN65795_c0_g1~~TRINITY_DN65795_c0_g1_i3.p1  ORF type:complete len:489 (-),score=31.54 TRINITY_DN65795_c0_g1_i3:993-2459(-)
MGVPSFYRWLSNRYPRIKGRKDGSANVVPGEYHNLYIDMNGIIHPCCSIAEGNLYGFNENQVIMRMFEYLDRLFELVQPTKVIYFAVDGVAPRAKINQQRARRYESARARRKVLEQDEDLVDVDYNDEVTAEMDELKQTLDLGIFGGGLSLQALGDTPAKASKASQEGEGDDVTVETKSTLSEVFGFVASDNPEDLLKSPSVGDPKQKNDDPLGWDRNSISPGTPFMMKIGQALKQYVYDKINNDPRWKQLNVIVSDTNTYGEGEHKMIEFIRAQRCQPDYNPTTRHLLAGLDADLVFLALALHEPYCDILRERRMVGSIAAAPDKVKFDVLRINTVRQYMEAEYRNFNCNWIKDLDVERVIDDFILLCFVGGNDFMPSLPTCWVDQYGLDHIFQVYHMSLPTLGAYLTKGGKINWKAYTKILAKYACIEDSQFQFEADAARESGRIPALLSGEKDKPCTKAQWSEVYYNSIQIDSADQIQEKLSWEN